MNKKTVAQQNEMPEYLYIVREEDGMEHYFVAHTDIDGIEKGTIVGVYKLSVMKVMSVKTELV